MKLSKEEIRDFNLAVGAIGRPRTGKTERLKEFSYQFPCVFYFDPNEDISGERSFYKLPSNAVIIGGKDKYGKKIASLSEVFYQFRVKKQRRIVYIPNDKGSTVEFELWLNYCYKIGLARYKHERNSPTVIFIDEIWNYVGQNQIPKILQELLREGRKYNILLFWTAQRLARMHSDIQTLSDWLYVFNLFNQDLKKIQELTAYIDKSVMRRLKKYECIRYDINNEEFYRVAPDGKETKLSIENSEIQTSGEKSKKRIQNRENQDRDSETE